jgi:hypothetical protein
VIAVAPGLRFGILALTLASALFVFGCGGHEARTLPIRSALDAGQPRSAIAALNKELDVKSDSDIPTNIQGDNALLVLDRASIQQSLAQYKLSEQDFGAADKAIDMLDLAHNAGDSIGAYVFSGSAEKYVAPPYEKLLVNTLNMLNYLETKDLAGAMVEARRLAVMQRYVRDQLHETDNAILGLGGFLAGLAFEKNGDVDEALHYYDDALPFAGFVSLRDPLRSLAPRGSFESPRIRSLVRDAPPLAPVEETGEAEIVVVIGYGRVPHKIAQRVPIGLALTIVANDISPHDRARANRLAAQGLVTWINFPTLAPGQGSYEIASFALDGRYVRLEQAVDVSAQVRAEWKKIEGKIILSAITRMISRLIVGEGIRRADSGVVGLLASLGTQATLVALDTPDTRSWETLPARVAIARVRVPAGDHHVALSARGTHRDVPLHLGKGDWAVVSLMALR